MDTFDVFTKRDPIERGAPNQPNSALMATQPQLEQQWCGLHLSIAPDKTLDKTFDSRFRIASEGFWRQ